MIPLMIQDLVNGQHFLNQVDFLAGYTLDQAVPGPLLVLLHLLLHAH